MLLGVAPFGLVAGVAVAEAHLGLGVSIGLSTIVFAGASQLAMTHVLATGGSALVAVVAACTINLRMVLYSASLAPHLTGERMGRRLIAAYVLTDQAYAVSISRWGDDDDPSLRFAFFVGAGFLLWGVWQVATLTGVLIGGSVPGALHLDFAIPLVFLVLLVPTVTDRPSAVAAVAGGAGAVIGAELGVGDLSILTGALSGIAAGVLAERHRDGPAGSVGSSLGRTGES
ncbi:MAG: AzlC family ABC transporter permease [Actinomycetota bacterium]|nr:AzlC family ABC transporter permease [Actinomycetota bacterium]